MVPWEQSGALGQMIRVPGCLAPLWGVTFCPVSSEGSHNSRKPKAGCHVDLDMSLTSCQANDSEPRVPSS